MSSDHPDERADTDEVTTPESAVDQTASEAESESEAETDDEAERSYDEKVLDELVPEISVGDEDPGEIDAELPGDDSVAADDSGLADALDALDDDLQQAFIRIVVGVKAGVLLISAGALAIGFQGMTTLGGALIAVGCLAFARAGHRYWSYERAGDDESHNG